MEKKCSQCGIVKSLEKFPKCSKCKRDGHQAYCLACHTKKQKIRYCPKKYKKYILLFKYGLSRSSFLSMLKKQNGKCPICNLKLSTRILSKKFGKNRTVVDHCHKTNRVRGILCTNCNVLLGMAKDSVEILQNAIDYLNGKSFNQGR